MDRKIIILFTLLLMISNLGFAKEGEVKEFYSQLDYCNSLDKDQIMKECHSYIDQIKFYCENYEEKLNKTNNVISVDEKDASPDAIQKFLELKDKLKKCNNNSLTIVCNTYTRGIIDEECLVQKNNFEKACNSIVINYENNLYQPGYKDVSIMTAYTFQETYIDTYLPFYTDNETIKTKSKEILLAYKKLTICLNPKDFFENSILGKIYQSEDVLNSEFPKDYEDQLKIIQGFEEDLLEEFLKDVELTKPESKLVVPIGNNRFRRANINGKTDFSKIIHTQL